MSNQKNNKMKLVSKRDFVKALKYNQAVNVNIKGATTPYQDVQADKTDRMYYLNNDTTQGYAISFNGELTSLYSTVKGAGANLLKSAIKHGALHLDCFDGFLTSFYAKQGFKVYKRVPNWTKGAPDVVYMYLINNN